MFTGYKKKVITADLIVLSLFFVCLFVGSAFGFGTVLKWVTGGVSGKIISLIVCYFLFGIVLDWEFVRAFMEKITTALKDDGSLICKVLLAIRIDMIAFAAVLFVAVQVLRRIVVIIIGKVMGVKNKVISVINRVLGVILLTTFAAIVMLIVFQVVAWVSGTECEFYQSLQGSAFGLDELFKNNPMNSVFESIRLPSQEDSPAE